MSAPTEIALEKRNEAYCTSAGIQYVCLAGKMDFDAYSYTGAFRVLRLIMAYEYLWLKIRLEGGAYGCMSGFSRTGNAYFVSYRDPNLEKTVAVYKDVPQYLEDYDGDDDAMTKYVIGAISELDTPLSPNAKGSRSFSAYVSGLTYEDVQRERDEVLSCSAAQIRALAGPIDSMLRRHILCTVGNEEKINENHSIFDTVEPLF